MRRAMMFLMLSAFALTLFDVPASRAKGSPVVNAIGMINYATAKPDFKPGDWVRYRVTSANNDGDKEDYFVTILIAGEEQFWGVDCFWVETRTQTSLTNNEVDVAIATLMSYSVFGDSLAISHSKLFMRKTIADMSEDGTPRQDVIKRPSLTLRNRKPPGDRTAWTVDTMGVDTVHTPRGLYACTLVKLEEGIAATADNGDSSARTEVREKRTVFFADGIPITGFARERIVNTVHRKSWPIGRSSEGEMKLVAESEGNARLVDYGTGLTSLLVPKEFQKSLREQAAAISRPAPARPHSKRTN